MISPHTFMRRAKAAGIHLIFSAAIAVAAAAVVFALWYPHPYEIVSGGRSLFLLLVSVDAAIGPLLTFVIFDIRKPAFELARDMAIVVLLQLAALGYGLHTVFLARPIALVFEVDRFRVVTAQDVYASELHDAPAQYQSLPLTGPWLLGTRRPAAGPERNDAIFMGLKGIDISARPRFWQPYGMSQADALKKSLPLSKLEEAHPSRRHELRAAAAKAGLSEATARYLPLVARVDWIALLDQRGQVVGFAPVDGFM